MSWFGGLAGGVGAGLLFLRLAQVPLVPALAAAAPALAMGQAIGRVGCFLVGDDYGRPTDLPWGVAFPQGSPPIDVHVHPTQLYEAALLVGIWYLLRTWGRAHIGDRWIVARYLTMVGIVRFAVEFIRVDMRVLGPFTISHFASLAAIGTGVALMVVRPTRIPSSTIPSISRAIR
jgi:phosphatidylglycerol:prolipoprotein diacylglycerol transferase